jgi:tetratricopeptide (TPR) repeat protein
MSSQELVESKGYSIHRCVHSWTIHVLNREWNYDLAKVAVKLVGPHVPEQEAARPWLTQRRLLQHAARCSHILLNGLVADDDIAWVYHNLGKLYKYQGKLTKAEEMYQRALRGYEKVLGTDNSSTYIPALNTIWALGTICEYQSDRAKARVMYSKALVGYERAVGPDYPGSQQLRGILKTLDNVTENGALKNIDGPADNTHGDTLRQGTEGDPSKVKRHKLLKRLGFR